jgi:hypothetical protein
MISSSLYPFFPALRTCDSVSRGRITDIRVNPFALQNWGLISSK